MTDASALVVVDTSLALKWVVSEVDTPQADALLASWDAADAILTAPALFVTESGNALYKAVRRGLLTLAGAASRHTALLQVMSIQLDDTADSAAALALADQLGQGASYDSVYLALAQRLGCDLWTADNRFARAATAHGYRVRMLTEG